MTLQEQKRVLIDYLNMKSSQSDWHAVSDAANDLREIEVELKLSVIPRIKKRAPKTKQKLAAVPEMQNIGNQGPPHAAAAPSKEIEIPHHVNEVSNLLKLDDYSLVDKLFPDYTVKDA